MATRNSTTKIRRNIITILEREREQLMKAEALLSCIQLALEYSDEEDRNRPYLPSVVEVTRDLVSASITHLGPDYCRSPRR
jgi:hypothetical protein